MGFDINSKTVEGSPIMFKASFYPESFKMFIERGVDLNQLDEDNCHILRQLIDDLDDHNPDLNTSFYPVLQLLAARETNGLNMLQKVRDHSRKFESIKFQPGVGTVENLAGAQYPSTPKKCFLAGTRFPSAPRIFSSRYRLLISTQTGTCFLRQMYFKTNINLRQIIVRQIF